MANVFFFFLLILINSPARAGVFELSASANFRDSHIDSYNYTKTVSYTGSVSYYFWEMSAIELSYTQGQSTLSAKPSAIDPQLLYISDFTMHGVDLVFSLTSRDAPIQPYVKVGGAKIKKDLVVKSEVGSIKRINSPDGDNTETVPSAGVGFKIMLTKTFSIKAGIDAWKTNYKKQDETTDYAGRAGISWLF